MHTVKAARRQEIELPKKEDDEQWQKLTPSSTVIGGPKYYDQAGGGLRGQADLSGSKKFTESQKMSSDQPQLNNFEA